MVTKGRVTRFEDISWRRNDDPRDWLNINDLFGRKLVPRNYA
jgi:hypothetical protein